MKIPFVDYKLYTTVLDTEHLLSKDLKVTNESTAVSLTKSRSSTIIANFVNRTISVIMERLLNVLK